MTKDRVIRDETSLETRPRHGAYFQTYVFSFPKVKIMLIVYQVLGEEVQSMQIAISSCIGNLEMSSLFDDHRSS